VLGVRPEWDGLRLDPCLPPDWNSAEMTRPYRGSIYHIAIERDADLPEGSSASVCLDGAPVDGNLLAPPLVPGSCHEVGVRCR
jgi:cellobiose phosphorylase